MKSNTIILLLTCLLTATTACADMQERTDSLTVDSLQKANERLMLANDSLQRELDALKQFREAFITHRLLGQSPDLEKPFSQATDTEFDTYIALLEPYKGNEEIDTHLHKVERYRHYLTLYQTYSLLLKMPFARQGIGDAYSDISKKLKSKIGTELNQAQFDDFDQLAIFMSRYYQGGKDFQALIKAVDEKLKNYQGNTDQASQDFCRQLVNQVLEQFKETIDKRIMNIEYMRQRYVTYTNSLKENPLSLTAEGKQAVIDINNMKLD